MCSCNKGKGIRQVMASSGIQSIEPYLRFAYCAYKSQFEQLFSQVGITANESTLGLLAQASDTGSDVAGVIKDTNGRPIVFSVEERLKLIDTSSPTNTSCSI